MTQVNIHAAKTNLSRIIASLEAEGGEAVVCRAGRPVARISPIPTPRKRRGGQFKGQIWLSDDFDAPDGQIFGIR